jgi:hypothetical protein
MEKYSIASQKLQDIAIKTVRLTARAGELGAVTATTITIPLADISNEAIAATDVLVARNITDSTSPVASISGTNLVLTDAAIAATDLIDLVIRLK